jgi:hypothetical protein
VWQQSLLVFLMGLEGDMQAQIPAATMVDVASAK